MKIEWLYTLLLKILKSTDRSNPFYSSLKRGLTKGDARNRMFHEIFVINKSYFDLVGNSLYLYLYHCRERYHKVTTCMKDLVFMKIILFFIFVFVNKVSVLASELFISECRCCIYVQLY